MTVSPKDAGKFAINSYSYTIDLDARQFLDRFADRGYRAFELMIYPGHLWPKDMSGAGPGEPAPAYRGPRARGRHAQHAQHRREHRGGVGGDAWP